MTITNHALTGALVGALIGNPLIALPVAFLSHFVMDILPHWDMLFEHKKQFLGVVLVDVSLATIFGLTLLILQPEHWLLILSCAVAATLADLIWFPHFLQLRKGKERSFTQIQYFLDRIQWFQRPVGAVVEVVWAAGMLMLIAPFVK